MDGDSTIFNTLVSDIQTGITISEDNEISGTSKFLTEGEIAGYWGAGNFIALQFSDIDPHATSVRVGLDPSQGSGLVEIIDDPDKNGVFKITNPTTQEFVVVTSDGTNEVTQRFSLQAVNCAMPEAYPNVEAVHGNTQIYGVNASTLQTGIQFNPNYYPDEYYLVGTVHEQDNTVPELEGYNIVVDITGDEDETLQAVYGVKNNEQILIEPYNGHYILPIDATPDPNDRWALVVVEKYGTSVSRMIYLSQLTLDPIE